MHKIDNRYKWIDVAKGLGIVLVVYGHVLRGIHGSLAIPLSESFFMFSDNFVYSFHMPLFFILSGLFFEKSLRKRTTISFLKEKLYSLAYPFIVWSILQTSIEFFLSKYTNGSVGIEELWTCLFIPRAQFWFLYALFFINLINLCLFAINKKYGLIFSMVLAVFLFGFDVDLGVFTRTANHLIYFNLGIMLHGVIFRYINVIEGSFFALLFSATLFLLLWFLFAQKEFVFNSVFFPWFNFVLALLGIVGVVLLSSWLVRFDFSLLFEKLGFYSMQIYLTHIIIGSGIRVALMKIGILSPLIHIIVGTTAGILIPCLIAFFADKHEKLRPIFTFPKRAI